jgi:hypothetical protein
VAVAEFTVEDRNLVAPLRLVRTEPVVFDVVRAEGAVEAPPAAEARVEVAGLEPPFYVKEIRFNGNRAVGGAILFYGGAPRACDGRRAAGVEAGADRGPPAGGRAPV